LGNLSSALAQRDGLAKSVQKTSKNAPQLRARMSALVAVEIWKMLTLASAFPGTLVRIVQLMSTSVRRSPAKMARNAKTQLAMTGSVRMHSNANAPRDIPAPTVLLILTNVPHPRARTVRHAVQLKVCVLTSSNVRALMVIQVAFVVA